MADNLSIPFVRAKYFTDASRTKIDLVVIHDMEYPERMDAAEAVANFFARGGSEASAHYCIDADSIVQCVKNEDVAWHAPGANSNGIGLEHAGYAAQRPEQWDDDYSKAELALSARLTRQLCEQYKIPIEYVDVNGLKAGKRGITTHNNVSLAFKKSTHTDPGPNFPMAHYIEMVRGTPLASTPAQQEVKLVVNAPVVGILSHPSWNGGYIEIGADGGAFSFEAPNYGSMGGTPLNKPVVGGAVTPDGAGYWLVGADGGVFAFGNARGDLGSMGGKTLNKPVVGMIATASGNGYWLVAQDGGVFNFGDAPFKGAVQYGG